MPMFECSRCNQLSYSASKGAVAPCQACGARRRRIVVDSVSFAEAEAVPRAVSYGDHSVAVFDDFQQVAPMAVQFIDQALLAGGLVIAGVPQELEDLVHERMNPEDELGVLWEPPSDSYGPTFSPDEVVERYREIAELEDRPVFVLTCADEAIQTFTSREGWVEYERRAHQTATECGLTVLGLYDARLHDDTMLRAGLRSHGSRFESGELMPDEAFGYGPPGA